MNAQQVKVKQVLERIQSIESTIAKANEYLATGEHAEWHRFRPLFAGKWDGDRELPPHKDWVRSTFLPRYQRSLRQAEKALERLEQEVR